MELDIHSGEYKALLTTEGIVFCVVPFKMFGHLVGWQGVQGSLSFPRKTAEGKLGYGCEVGMLVSDTWSISVAGNTLSLSLLLKCRRALCVVTSGIFTFDHRICSSLKVHSLPGFSFQICKHLISDSFTSYLHPADYSKND